MFSEKQAENALASTAYWQKSLLLQVAVQAFEGQKFAFSFAFTSPCHPVLKAII
ncbi:MULTISPECIES: hypothetical protein [Rufibacter]|uniref:hypothetical protein n=1 Tax=Rufibacter TaxID=1379908 RepID=UPI000A4DAFB5|nr:MULTISPECIES: hypothetical protein [Rufibacter]